MMTREYMEGNNSGGPDNTEIRPTPPLPSVEPAVATQESSIPVTRPLIATETPPSQEPRTQEAEACKIWKEQAKQAESPAQFPVSPGDAQTIDEIDERNHRITVQSLLNDPKIASELMAWVNKIVQEKLQAAAGGRRAKMSSYEREFSELSPDSQQKLLAKYQEVGKIPQGAFDEFDDDYETLIVQMGVGPTEVEWPKSTEGKLLRMRKVMDLLETYEEGQEAPGLGPLYREVEAVVTNLTSSSDEARKKQGNTLRTEEKARIALHTGYIGFKLADTIDNVRDAVKNTIWSPHIGWAMQQDLVIEALQYYEDHAEDYIRATSITRGDIPSPPDKLKAFEKNAVGFLTEYSQAHPEKSGLTAEAARRIAERIWLISGRAVMHDWIEINDKQEWAFVGDFKGGSFQLRRTMRMNEWMYTIYVDHWFPELMYVVNLGTPDWFEWFGINSFDKYKTGGSSFDKVDKEVAVQGQDGYHREIKKDDLKRRVTQINFRSVHWGGVNFADIGERPFDFWTYRKIQQPEGARRKLTETGGVLKDPTEKNLFKPEVIDIFSYLGPGHLTNNERLLSNVIDFLEKSNQKKRGRANISHDHKEAILHQAVESGFLQAHQAHHLEEKKLGRWRIPRRLHRIFNVFEFIKGVLAKMIEKALHISV